MQYVIGFAHYENRWIAQLEKLQISANSTAVPNEIVGQKLKNFVASPTMIASKKEILSISCISVDVDVACGQLRVHYEHTANIACKIYHAILWLTVFRRKC